MVANRSNAGACSVYRLRNAASALSRETVTVMPAPSVWDERARVRGIPSRHPGSPPGTAQWRAGMRSRLDAGNPAVEVYRGQSLRLLARTPWSWLRELISSLVKALCRWYPTVRRLMNSFAAISGVGQAIAGQPGNLGLPGGEREAFDGALNDALAGGQQLASTSGGRYAAADARRCGGSPRAGTRPRRPGPRAGVRST